MIVLNSLHDDQLVTLLKSGKVGVVPTDTIYGLAAAAGDKQAVERLYALKDREQKPGTVIAASIEQLRELGLAADVLRKVEHLWPNPISIVLPAPESLDYLDQNVGSLAVRVPKDEVLQRLLERTGPLVTSSANHPGEPPANNLAEASGYFKDAVDFYVDGGDRSGRPASTVVRLNTDGSFKTLRPGALTIDEKGSLL